MSFTDALYRSRSRDEATGRSSRPRARGVEDAPANEPEPAIVQHEEPQQSPVIKLAGAWKRCLLGEDGKLHSDGRLIIKDLFKQSGFFSKQQYVPVNHDQTLALAVKRQLVTHILALTGLSEAAIEKQVNRAFELREQIFNDD